MILYYTSVVMSCQNKTDSSPAILNLVDKKRKDTIRILKGACQGAKDPPYGGRFSPCHPSVKSSLSFRLFTKMRIAGLPWEIKVKIRQITGNLTDFSD
jgi:hypothetical protein